MTSVESLKTLTLDLPPSCIEFWPLNPQYAVIGTYNLQKPDESSARLEESDALEAQEKRSQQRNGSLILAKVEGDDITIISTLRTPSAILDIHFWPTSPTSSLFAVATSTGTLALYTIVDDASVRIKETNTSATPQFKEIRTIPFFAENVLITAFAWHPSDFAVGMTLSDNSVHIGDIGSYLSQDSLLATEIVRHDLEAWTLAFLPDGSGVYSGGDDSVLAFRTLPEQTEMLWAPAEVQPAVTEWKDKRIHGAGVTAILPLQVPTVDSIVLTGSYDDHLRLLHAPSAGRRTVLAEVNLGGGVWRLKRLDDPSTPSDLGSEGEQVVALILASCMHAGTRILQLIKNAGEDDWTFRVVAEFTEHKSMNYGSDCQPHPTPNGQRTFVTTSFYDRLLCLWRH